MHKVHVKKEKESGATMIEFILGLPVFIFTIVMAISIIYYIYKISNLQYVTHMAVRDGVVDAFLNDETSPNSRISNRIFTNPLKYDLTVSSVNTCRVNSLPACLNETIPNGELFMTKTEATQDMFSRAFGLNYVVWVLGVNSHPISIEKSTL
jgi:hypothetical protein